MSSRSPRRAVASLDSWTPAGGEALLRDYLDAVDGNPVFRSNPAFVESEWLGVSPALDRWHRLVERQVMNDDVKLSDAQQGALVAEMSDLIDDNIIFSPPTYWQSRPGKMTTMWILKQVSEIFREFSYQRQVVDASKLNVVLEFSCMVDEIPCQGVDIITFSPGADAKIVDFKVMIRPPEAAIRIKQHMSERAKKMKHLFRKSSKL